MTFPKLLSRISLGIIFASCLLGAAQASNKDQLIFAVDIIRHGDRTPTSNLPAAPHVWEQGLGQLTPLGMQQEHALGEKIHNRYVNNLLPDTYQAGTMYVRSSDLDRTLMSAQCVCLGLYPLGTGPLIGLKKKSMTDALPSGFQTIPIHTVTRTQEPLLICDDDKNTAISYNFNDLLKTYVFSTPEWQAKEAALKPHFEAWSAATGKPIKCLYDLKPIADALSISRSNNLPMPTGLSDNDATTIIDAGHWAFVNAFKNPTLGKVTGAPLLQEVLKYFTNATKDPASQAPELPSKYVLFSAHDSTILSEMTALGAPRDEVPPYSSDLNISLFSSGNNGYYVMVTYNDQPITLPCNGSTTCSWELFKTTFATPSTALPSH